MPLWRPLQWVHNRLWSALSWPVELMGGGVGSECLEWTVAISDLLFIGMQQNGQWSVMWGVLGTDLVLEMILVMMVCFSMNEGFLF